MGTFARFMRLYVGEGRALPLMEGIRRITLLPARRLEKAVPRMKRKGRIQPGSDADIVIFDAAALGERATYKEPSLRSAGVKYAVVNGTMVLENGRIVDGVAPGQ